MLNKEQALSVLARLTMLQGWCVAGREHESLEMLSLIELELAAIRNDIGRAFGSRYDPQTKSVVNKIDEELGAGSSPADILKGLGNPFE